MLQVIEMTHEEKIKMYMKYKKIKLIEMLISCNNHLDRMVNLDKPTYIDPTQIKFE